MNAQFTLTLIQPIASHHKYSVSIVGTAAVKLWLGQEYMHQDRIRY